MRVFVTVLILLLFAGCSVKNEKIDKELAKEVHLHVYSNELQDIWAQRSSPRKLLYRFPFVGAPKGEDIRGKFDNKFYSSINLVYNAKKIEDVDFWKLRDNPKSLDFIYVRPLWIKEYRKLTKDLFANIAYSYNISAKEQEILRDWVYNGGKLWLEFGVYSTKYDMFNKNGEIDPRKIEKLIKNSFTGLTFWKKPLRSFIFKSDDLDLINYLPTIKRFRIDERKSQIKGIKRLKLNIYNYMENYVLVDGKALLVDKQGRTLVTLNRFGKGYVLSMLPFEYQDVYYDGELLRWKLLFMLYERR
ncbi:hypothetical protein NitYY0826_C1514 [Nitratiruptor sp. YY08-26]|uniref:hypothetical protein n=1 Tax=unclassified Nitratiruptor TaxID=2624044 RepID=UPI0019162B36|nr:MULTISPECIES: hypothetical protein [unclassified Nitratiruptor]BCD62632.1 hypothetical protein NitYY0813_C1512 [Nitratiruptor sp. YY08-13]BCD66568.1 hypothetical protein NitYY0826_C1514 [Nitratiruptor sp. YY08-26]